MKIVVNGKPKTTQAKTIEQLVEELQLLPQGLVVAVNDLILKKTEWESTRLSEGDSIELIQLVAGG